MAPARRAAPELAGRPRAAGPAPSPRRAGRRILIGLLVALVLVAAGAVAGLVIIKRLETGSWQVPEVQDLERIIKLSPRAPARVIYLARRPLELRPGADDSAHGVSSVLASVRSKAAGATKTTRAPDAVDRPAKLPGWSGSDKAWNQVVACVDKLFAPFAVTVTDQPPAVDNFVLVAVGGRPGDIGVKERTVGGLAPFNGGVIAKPVVFAFSQQLGNDVRAVCETIGMEVAHAYGLDHGYACSDVMTYLAPCGTKKFLDKDVRCGERKPRACEGGEPTQNSYRLLLQVLGARPTTAKPTTTKPTTTKPTTTNRR